MKHIHTISLALALLLPSATAATADSSVPGNVLFNGTTATTAVRSETGWCAVAAGPSTFENEGSNAVNLSLDAVSYLTEDAFYEVSGMARLKFKTATTGTVRFDFAGDLPKGVRQPTFSNYKERYSRRAGRLKTSFQLNFPDCSVQVKAIYRD